MIIVCSGAFYSALEELISLYEKKTNLTLSLAFGSSMNISESSIPARLERKDKIDMVVMAAPELERMEKAGLIQPGTRRNLALSNIGMVVRSGAEKMDISTPPSLEKTLLSAESIGYSASASGNYLVNELFPALSVWEKIKNKLILVSQGGVASQVANGSIQIGFQQVSELLGVAGVDFAGTLPLALQKTTIFSAGIPCTSHQREQAEKLIDYLLSPEVYPIITAKGLEPASLSK